MRYTSKIWMFFLLFWVGFGSLQAQTELQPLPVDPKVRYGKLSNGLTYYIRHNELPKDRADFYIAQNVGSILKIFFILFKEMHGKQPARTGSLPGTHGL